MAILTVFRHRFYKNDGTVNSGGKVYTYTAGTTTPTPTYTDSGAGTPNANPIILDSKGEADIWVSGLIKVNVLESDDTQVTGWPVDNIGAASGGSTTANATWAGTAAGTANALTITPSTAISAYAIGQSFIFKAGASANTSTTTISISGLSAIAVQSNGAACAGGEILANNFYMGVLDTLTTFQITKVGKVTLAELGLGTGVATALAIAVGSAGAVVTNGGAGGTPSSLTLTNATGLPQAGTVGLTTADSPEFAALNIGHASDTTLTRVSAGKLAQEGVTLADLGANTFTAAQNFARATVASHATTADIWAAAGNQIDWTGTATTTAFPNAPQGGASRTLICAGACSFTAGANMLIDGVASASTVTCAANDKVIVEAVSTTQFKLSRVKYDGTAQVSAGGSSVVRSARTSNTILAEADRGTLIDITSGTFSQTFTAAATLTSGWFCYIKNSGTGDITLEPNGAELIDGLTNYIMYGGETRLVQCTGTAFTSVVLSPFYRAFTTTETFTKPPGYSAFGGMMWSGGGSGAKKSGAAIGGAGGGCLDFTLLAAAVAATETITIGAGGVSVTANTTDGNVGGATSVGTLVTIRAGSNAKSGGQIRDTASVGTTTLAWGYEGRQDNNNATIYCNTVWGGSAASTDGSTNSGSSVYGGAAGGSSTGAASRVAGTSQMGGNGGNGSHTGNAVDGTAPGGGGGAAQDSVGNSGAGARGECRIWGLA